MALEVLDKEQEELALQYLTVIVFLFQAPKSLLPQKQKSSILPPILTMPVYNLGKE